MAEQVAGLDHGAAELRQLDRQHIVVVNRDPAFLDLVRLLLQQERYNVTTTNFVPRTFHQIVALRPALLIIDLQVAQFSGWDLLERLHADALINTVPVIITATDPQLLDHAHRHRQLYGGQDYLALPFVLNTLLDTIHAIIGGADAGRDEATEADR